MADTARARLVKASARLELLRERNDQQRAHLGKAATQMADSATGFAASIRDQVDSDPAAATAARRALVGRYTARQIAGGSA